MRMLVSAALLLTAATPVSAQIARPLPYTYHPAEPRIGQGRPAECPRPMLQHTAQDRSTGPQTLAQLPSAWRIHAVERSVRGCAVAPEAQKVSDRSGKLAGVPPSRR